MIDEPDTGGESIIELKARLAETEETLRAIREGEVDAIVVSGPQGPQVYSLAGAESIYRTIVDTMNDSAVVVTFEGTVLYGNAQFGALLKRPLDQIVSHRLQEFVAAEDCATLENFLVEGRRQALRRRLVFAASDGSAVPAHMSSNVLESADGPNICIVATDLTELENSTELIGKLREQRTALAESEARLAGIIGSAMDSIISVDEFGRIVVFNAAAEKVFGCAAADALGRPLEGFIPPRFRAAHAEHMRGFGASETIHKPMTQRGEIWGLRADGTEFPIEASISQAQLGRKKLFTVVLRDITERRRADQSLAQKAEELARSNADLEQFAYVASHDLKEPLRAVSGCTQLLQRRCEGKLDDLAAEYMAHIVDGTTRMESLIDGLLAFSRVGTRGAKLEAVDCARVLDTALRNLAAAIEESGTVVSSDRLPTVHGDAIQLVSLFQNLIGNALKFRQATPPLIHVGAQRQDKEWYFSIRDNGIGISPRYFDRIFGIFQRLHTRDEYPGTGIGLAVCKKIVERHGGRIWLESAPGEGTTFYFSLSDAQTTSHRQGREAHA